MIPMQREVIDLRHEDSGLPEKVIDLAGRPSVASDEMSRGRPFVPDEPQQSGRQQRTDIIMPHHSGLPSVASPAGGFNVSKYLLIES